MINFLSINSRITKPALIVGLTIFNLGMTWVQFGPRVIKHIQANSSVYYAFVLPNSEHTEFITTHHTIEPETRVIGTLTEFPSIEIQDPRIEIIRAKLIEYSSPMLGLEEYIIDTADQHGVDPYLIVAIAGQESSFGKYRCGFNAWGYASCKVRFNSWEEGIDRVATLLSKPPYSAQVSMDNWSIQSVGRVYAEDPNWASKVQYFYTEIASAR